MSYTEKLQAAFLAVKNTKRQEVPDAVQKKLLQWASVATPDMNPHLQAICDGLVFHAEMLNIPAFSFSPLLINWPSHPQAPLNHYAQAIQHRKAITQQLEKDGVAILLTPDTDGNRFNLSMEDMKGRVHPLLMATLKNKGFVDTTFHFGDGKSVQAPTLDTREWEVLHTYLPAEAVQKIEPFLKRLLLIRPQGGVQSTDLKLLWNCGANGIEHSRGGGNAFPVIGGVVSAITHEQCYKIAPDLLPYLSNAARKGPTQTTISKAMQTLLDEHKDAPWTGAALRKELMDASSAFAGGAIGEQMPDILLDQLAERLHSYPPAQRKGLLIEGVMRSAVMFNGKAGVERKHDPLSLTTPHKLQSEAKNQATPSTKSPAPAESTSKPAVAAETFPDVTTDRKQAPYSRREAAGDPVQVSQENALLDLFKAYHSTLTAPQLARKFLEVAHPFGLLPLTTEDVRVIDNIIDTMKRTPSRAVHGVRWLMDVIRDAQLNMLEHAPSSAPSDPMPRQEHAPSAPKR